MDLEHDYQSTTANSELARNGNASTSGTGQACYIDGCDACLRCGGAEVFDMTEEVRERFDRFDEKLDSLHEKMGGVDKRLAVVETQFRWIDLIFKSIIVTTITGILSAFGYAIAKAWHAIDN